MRSLRWLIGSGYWLALTVWAVMISWFSSRTAEEIPTFLGCVSDKILHAAAFGVFTLLFLLAVHRGFRCPARPAMLVAAVLAAVLYGLLDEWHQSLVETRVASAADLLADAAGSIAALPSYSWLSRKVRGRYSQGRAT